MQQNSFAYWAVMTPRRALSKKFRSFEMLFPAADTSGKESAAAVKKHTALLNFLIAYFRPTFKYKGHLFFFAKKINFQ